MIAKFNTYYRKNGWLYEYESKTVNSIIFDERLDEQLDTGTVQTVEKNADEEKFRDFQVCKLVITDSTEETLTKEFVSFSSNHKRGKNYFLYTHELVEPIREFMGWIIDGKKVTQPIDGSPKKTLREVLVSLFDTANLLKKTSVHGFIIEQSETLDVESPEFHWESGTLLWECLLDVGNVINCIPRLSTKPNAQWGEHATYNYLSFEKVNDIKGVYDL